MTMPDKDDRLTEDDRFHNSDRTSIKPVHAVLRCLASFGDITVSNGQIVKAFFDAGSSRQWDEDSLAEALMEGVEAGWIDQIPDIGHRLTETGRNEIGPMMEMELKYI